MYAETADVGSITGEVGGLSRASGSGCCREEDKLERMGFTSPSPTDPTVDAKSNDRAFGFTVSPMSPEEGRASGNGEEEINPCAINLGVVLRTRLASFTIAGAAPAAYKGCMSGVGERAGDSPPLVIAPSGLVAASFLATAQGSDASCSAIAAKARNWSRFTSTGASPVRDPSGAKSGGDCNVGVVESEGVEIEGMEDRIEGKEGMKLG